MGFFSKLFAKQPSEIPLRDWRSAAALDKDSASFNDYKERLYRHLKTKLTTEECKVSGPTMNYEMRDGDLHIWYVKERWPSDAEGMDDCDDMEATAGGKNVFYAKDLVNKGNCGISLTPGEWIEKVVS
jgi:hypothetical protein